jgi:hypothetical protein
MVFYPWHPWVGGTGVGWGVVAPRAANFWRMVGGGECFGTSTPKTGWGALQRQKTGDLHLLWFEGGCQRGIRGGKLPSRLKSYFRINTQWVCV